MMDIVHKLNDSRCDAPLPKSYRIWGETSPLCWTKITKWQKVQ